ncbi:MULTISPECIES: acyl-CoA dehydrogenase family protein [Streptomyces]|uniref:acyl-CoA dehydrogenase family protein n=1 Tax=Streptomyces TaxID=1883 RepID=UPI00116322C3|nr:acyl-CoA dehydrogenase family protein [Streptomyces sp. RLB3-6]QDN85803.1 acyl-CoA dehydrogenase [Streptomyces sp. RLB3-6]
MNIDLSREATEYGRQVLRALETAGGDRLVQQAEEEPDRREKLVAPVLAELGAWELDVRGSADELEAAAAVCRAAGYRALAYPVAERLSRPADLDADGLLVVGDNAPAGAVADLDLRWVAVTLDGERSHALALPPSSPPRHSAFVADLDLTRIDGGGAADAVLGLVLPCWTLLGMLDRAIDLTRAHVVVRTQFGRPLSAFQAVQFQLTDAEVERGGVEMLAKYALWSLRESPADALADALALRLAALEAAQTVFRVAHQLQGATGFCDEAFLSWLSRYSQPVRRLPLGLSATRDQLAGLVDRRGLTGLFTDAADPHGRPTW